MMCSVDVDMNLAVLFPVVNSLFDQVYSQLDNPRSDEVSSQTSIKTQTPPSQHPAPSPYTTPLPP